MNIFISTFLGWAFFLGAIFGWTFFLAFVVWRVRIMHKERLAKKSQRKREEKRKSDSDKPPVCLSPEEYRKYMLNHIEDGRLYVISSLFAKDSTIVCAKRFDVETQSLCCYAHLWISEKGDCNLHIDAPFGPSKMCDFPDGKTLRIDQTLNPTLFISEEEYIFPFISDYKYSIFVLSLRMAGLDWEIEKEENNMVDSHKYRLKEKQEKK